MNSISASSMASIAAASLSGQSAAAAGYAGPNNSGKSLSGKSISMDPCAEIVESHSDGSYLVRNGSSGAVVRTCDVLGVKREYRREPFTNQLMVLRFGKWNKPQDGQVLADGTFIYRQGDTVVEEKLNGLHTQLNDVTGVSIITDHLNNAETVKQSNGEIWRRQVLDGKESFEIWLDGHLRFRTQSMAVPCRWDGPTPMGEQALTNVSRIEHSWESDILIREKFAFTNPLNQQKDMMLTVQVPGGMLMLNHVAAVVTEFSEGKPKRTSYDLAAPTTARYEALGSRRQFPNIVRVRCVATNDGATVVLINADGNVASLG